jgi:pimeloyl-ACP methyl ester carboxylesterase
MTDDLLAVMDHLELAKAHLVGHSTGGRSARRWRRGTPSGS